MCQIQDVIIVFLSNCVVLSLMHFVALSFHLPVASKFHMSAECKLNARIDVHLNKLYQRKMQAFLPSVIYGVDNSSRYTKVQSHVVTANYRSVEFSQI